MFTPREYQARAIFAGVEFLEHGKGRGGLIVLPTGAGKSIVIAGIAATLKDPCIIFQPSREILAQNASKLVAYGYDPKVYSASMGQRERGEITLATIGSVKNHADLFQEFPHIIIDEAHLVSADGGMYMDFINALGSSRVLGLTATPFRLSTDSCGAMLKFLTRTRPRVFEEIVAYEQVGSLIARGYLHAPKYQIVHGFTPSELTLNASGGDYDDESVRRYFNRIGFADRMRRVVNRLLDIGRKNVVVFTRYVDDAEILAHGVPGMAVLSAKTTDRMRRAIVDGLRSGQITSVANVGVLGVGFDYPELETVVLARPTLSLAVYYQQVGRVIRPHPHKAAPWVVDMVDQVRQFGKIEDLWLQPGGKRGKSWEMVSKPIGERPRVLTNVYFGGGKWTNRQKRAFAPQDKPELT